MTDVIQVTATTGNREEAQRIAAELVDNRLAACVQIGGPIESAKNTSTNSPFPRQNIICYLHS